MKIKWRYVFEFIALLSIGFCIGALFQNNLDNPNIQSQLFNNSIPPSEQTVLNNCANMSLVNVSYCLRNNIMPIYNYTVRTDIIRTFDDIKTNGGDCYDYSHLYQRLANELNYSADVETISATENESHAIVILHDGSGYCMIDQLDVHCEEYEPS